MPLILGTNSIKDTGYEVANSVRLDSASTAYLSRTVDLTEGSTSQHKFTISCWFKLGKTGQSNGELFGAHGSNDYFTVRVSNGNAIDILSYDDAVKGRLVTNQLLRDHSAWYHIVVACDSNNGSGTNRMRLYLNGSEVTSFSTDTHPTSGTDLIAANMDEFNIGRNVDQIGGAGLFDGYIAEFVYIDNDQLEPDSFGEFDEDSPSIWKPKNVSGISGLSNTFSFYLDFEDSSNLGNDVSGNNNDFTSNNLTALDQSTDTCTNNFCTLNPLSADEMTFSNGNLDVDQASDDGGGARSDDNARGTMGVNSGKWYWEVKVTGATAPVVVGICFDELKTGFSDLSGSTGVYAIQNASTTYAYRRENGTTSETSGYPNPVANNILNVAFDADNGKLYIGINGTYYNQAGTEGNPATGSNPTFSSIDTSFFWLPWIESRGDNQQALMNFGSGTSYSISSGNADGEGFGNFEYAVPSGYFALCTKNLAEYG